MKSISREDIQRMTNSTGISGSSRSGSGGGGGGADLSGYATELWVNQNYLSIEFFSKLFKAYNGTTEVTPNDTETTITNIKAMFGFWTEQYISALGQGSDSGGGGGATALVDLVDVAISSPVAGQALVYDGTHWRNGNVTAGTVTSVGMTVPTGLSVSPSSITSSGTFAITFASGYSIPTTAKQSNWDAAYTDKHTHSNKSVLDDITSTLVSHWNEAYTNSHTHSNKSVLDGISSTKVSNWDAAYSYRSALNVSRTIWGQTYWNDGPANVSGALSSVTDVSMSGVINSSATDNVLQINNAIYVPTSVRIGDALLTYDSANNALKIQNADGTAANLYATGGVSALGMSAGTSTDTMKFNYATTNYATINYQLNVNNEVVANSGTMLVKQHNDADGVLMFNASTYSKINSKTYYYNQYDNVGLRGTDYNYSDSWWIDPDGCARFARLYLDATRYLYVSSGTLYYYNGTTSKQISFTN